MSDPFWHIAPLAPTVMETLGGHVDCSLTAENVIFEYARQGASWLAVQRERHF
jgi:hypothetical protein